MKIGVRDLLAPNPSSLGVAEPLDKDLWPNMSDERSASAAAPFLMPTTRPAFDLNARIVAALGAVSDDGGGVLMVVTAAPAFSFMGERS